MAKQERPIDPMQLKGLDGTFETVTIQGEGGPVRINKHEYDEEEHGKQIEDVKAPRRSRAKKSKQELEELTVDELKADLDRRQIEYPSDAHKDDLVKLARSA